MGQATRKGAGPAGIKAYTGRERGTQAQITEQNRLLPAGSRENCDVVSRLVWGKTSVKQGLCASDHRV